MAKNRYATLEMAR